MTATTAVSNSAFCTCRDIWPSITTVRALKVDSWSFALVRALSFSLALRIPQVPLTNSPPPFQQRSHSFLMFLMFGLPLRWLMRRHMAMVCYQIWAKLRSKRQSKPFTLTKISWNTSVWQSFRFAQFNRYSESLCFHSLIKETITSFHRASVFCCT